MDTVTDSTPRQGAALPRLLTVKEVAQLTGYQPGTIYHMVSEGTLPSVKSGDQRSSGVRIPEDAYRAWFKSLTVRNPVKTRIYNRRRKAA